ncbi:hypothetical protein SDC9_161503 [bioreactor metagenome]|uniref:Uncharacterized protein n=1 Tax=bioreactor metagenome TaxID=1076179 RepID=A0A645FII8_9ZZZZ
MVGLIHEHDDIRYTNLTGKQNVLAGLRHRAIRGRHDQYRAIHLRRARDHVLNIVRVAGAVYVRIVAAIRLVLYVRRVDRYSARLLFRRFVDVVIFHRLRMAKLGQYDRDRRRQRRLAMVYVSYRPYIYMRFVSFKFRLCHFRFYLQLILMMIIFYVIENERRVRFIFRGSFQRHCGALPHNARTASRTYRGPALSNADPSRSRTSPKAVRRR